MENIHLISYRNSLILKGLGILLMLIHHLFYAEAERTLYNDIIIYGHGLTNQLAIFSKLCVSLFVFVSGYGLSCKYKDCRSWKQYYVSRFKKLYLNYWFIWLVFVPIGVFVFHRTFEDVYVSNVIIKAGMDFLGILNLTGQLGYNPTWWFYSCIIILYLIFPWLNTRFEKNPYLFLTIGLFAAFIGFLPFVQPYSRYILPFLAGMLMARKPLLFETIEKGEIITSLFLLCMMRNFSGSLIFIVDTMICIGVAMGLCRIRLPNLLDSMLTSFGKHSMNIFLFHTFIFLYWFRDYVYFTRNPLLIFITLLISCYIISVFIEILKNKIGFYRLTK